MSRTCAREGWKGVGVVLGLKGESGHPMSPSVLRRAGSITATRAAMADGATHARRSRPPRATLCCHRERESSTERHVPKLGAPCPNWGTQRTPTGDAAAAQDGRQEKRSPPRPPRRGQTCRAGAVTHLLTKSRHPSSSPGRATVGRREHGGKRRSGKKMCRWALGCVHMQILALPKLKNVSVFFSPLGFPMILSVSEKKDKARQI